METEAQPTAHRQVWAAQPIRLRVSALRSKEVLPLTRPSREAIDWSIPVVKIGDRPAHGLRKLSDNTIRRIAKGLEKFIGEAAFVQSNRADNVATGLNESTHTLTASGQHQLISVPFLVHRGYSTVPECDRILSIDNPAPTQTTSAKLYIAQPFIDAARTHNLPTKVSEPTATVTTGRTHSLIHPPELFIDGYYGNGGSSASVDKPCPTLRTKASHALIAPTWESLVEECGYRMLQPHEAKWLQGFPTDYLMMGNQEEQYKLAGNAVPPVFAEMLGRAVVESLD